MAKVSVAKLSYIPDYPYRCPDTWGTGGHFGQTTQYYNKRSINNIKICIKVAFIF